MRSTVFGRNPQAIPILGPILSLIAFNAGWLFEKTMLLSVLYVTPPTVTLNAGLLEFSPPGTHGGFCGDAQPCVYAVPCWSPMMYWRPGRLMALMVWPLLTARLTAGS